MIQNNFIYIKAEEEVHLSEQYRFSHNLCVHFYDDIVIFLKNDIFLEQSSITFSFKDAKRPAKDTDIINWLSQNGYEHEVADVMHKHVLFALLADVCFFVHEALSSMKRMKTTVALHLLRKPFLESLLLLEQLIVDSKGFLKKFSQDSEFYDPGKLKDQEKLQIITEVTTKLFSNKLFDPNVIFNFRYDKKSPSSIYAASNQAIHLVTTRHPSYKTGKENLNLLFANQQDIESQVDYFYFALHHLLYYTAEVVEFLMQERKVVELNESNYRRLLRLIGYMFHSERETDVTVDKKPILDHLSSKYELQCPKCNSQNVIYKVDFFTLFTEKHLSCKHCLHELTEDLKALKPLFSLLDIFYLKNSMR